MSPYPHIFRARLARLLLLSVALAIVFRQPLTALVRLALQNESYNYIFVVPALTAFLLYVERRHIFIQPKYSPGFGLALGLAGLLVYLGSEFLPIPQTRLTLAILALVLLWIGGFVLCYGPGTFRRAAFPVLLLLCIVPAPAFLLERAIQGLRIGSADFSYLLFKLAGVPFLKQGFSFFLPGAEIQVAEQCSGIRSSASLLIAGLLAGHAFLQSTSRKILLAVCIVPIVIFKNALRIVTIALLGVYVDRGFFTGKLHHDYGGLVFSAIAIAILVPLVWALQRSEQLGDRRNLVKKPEIALGPDPKPQDVDRVLSGS